MNEEEFQEQRFKVQQIVRLRFQWIFSNEDVQDIVHEAYARAWKAMRTLDLDLKYVARIAVNYGIDIARLKRYGRTFSLNGPSSSFIAPENYEQWLQQAGMAHIPDCADRVIEGLAEQRFVDAILSLPEYERKVLVLHDLYGWPRYRIAAHLKISRQRVRTEQVRARARLRRIIKSRDWQGFFPYGDGIVQETEPIFPTRYRAKNYRSLTVRD